MTRKLLIAMALAATGFASVAAALGLGSIDSQSTLNEPLRARIELLSADPDEIDRITAQLAAPEAFERAGLERPFFLSRLDFSVVREGGSVFLEVTTNGAVKEPFLDFLVEVNWPNGRLLREYTLLLDPPTYTDDIAPNVAAGGSAVDAEPGSADQPEAASAAPAAAPAEAARGETVSGGGGAPAQYGPVRASDTLYSISQQMRPQGVSINQTMLALLRTNPDAFIDGNINALRRGAILRMPGRPELTRLGTAEATAEVREQMARWQERRSAPTADGGTEIADAETEADAGPEAGAEAAAEAGAEAGDDAAATAAADESEAASEAATAGEALAAANDGSGDGELRLVAPEESEGVDATASLVEADLEATPESVSRLQGQLALLEESNASLRAENSDLQSQVEGLRQELDELQRMINLRLAQDLPLADEGAGASADAGEATGGAPAAGDDQAADAATGDAAATAADGLDAPVSAGGEETVAEVATGSQGADDAGASESAQPEEGGADAMVAGAGTEEPPAASEPEVTETAQVSEEQPATAMSFLEMMLADTRLMTYAGGGIVALLLLLLLVQRRRRAAAADAGDEGLPSPAVAPVAAAGGAAVGAAAEQSGGISAEAGDPLEEAELYMAYGRADQAQDVLDRALGEEPDNIELRTRLLEILAERGDRGGFEAEAQVLHTQLASEDDSRWQRVVGLGHSVAPDHPLFADAANDADEGVTAAGPDGAADAETGRADASAAGEDAGTVDDLTDAAAGDSDFAFAADTATDPATRALSEPAASDAGDDLAVAHAHPDREETGSMTANAGSGADDDELGDLEFDLGDFSFDEEEPAAAGGERETAARGDADGGLEFSLEAPTDGAAAEENPLEFSLDDDLDLPDSQETNADDPVAGDGEDLDFGDFSLDEPRRQGGDNDDGGDIDGLDEVGTKLDLARAYMDMGDAEGARSLLDEVSEEGNEAQRREAEELLQRTG